VGYSKTYVPLLKDR